MRRRSAYIAIAVYVVVYCAVWWLTSRNGLSLLLIGTLFVVATWIAGGVAEVVTRLPSPLLISSLALSCLGLLSSRLSALTELHTLMFFIVVSHLGARLFWKSHGARVGD